MGIALFIMLLTLIALIIANAIAKRIRLRRKTNEAKKAIQKGVDEVGVQGNQEN